MMPRSRAVLIAMSRELTGAQLAQAAGVEPDKQWEKGALRAGDPKHGVHEASGIEYTSHSDRSAPPDAHVGELGQRVVSVIERIGQLQENGHQVEMRCWVYCESDDLMVGFDLSPSSLEPFTSAGCLIGINVDFVGDVVESASAGS